MLNKGKEIRCAHIAPLDIKIIFSVNVQNTRQTEMGSLRATGIPKGFISTHSECHKNGSRYTNVRRLH